MTQTLSDPATQVDPSEFTDILYETRDGIAKITINRPDTLNSLRTETYAELRDAFKKGTADPTIGVFVLTGAGDKAFSSGGDIRDKKVRTPHVGREHMRVVVELGQVMRTSGKPIIAAVNGYAIGAGNELNTLCDLTIASERAKFGQTGPKVASMPFVATQMLARMMGEKKAREVLYLCQQYSGEEAVRMGLANKIVPHEELYDEVEKWCQMILDKSPRALRIAKLTMNHGSDLNYNAMLTGAEMLAMTYGDEENREGSIAFLEKRPPDYRKFRRP